MRPGLQVHGKSCPDLLTRDDLNGSAVTVYNPFRNGKTEAGAAGFAVSCHIGAVETLEDVLHVLVAHADSVILHGNVRAEAGAVDSDPEGDGIALCRVFGGIVHEDADCLFQHSVITVADNIACLFLQLIGMLCII